MPPPPPPSAHSVAGVIARLLRARGVDRVFTLCGGHVMPLWMRLDADGIRLVDVRDERAAVHMAHAHAELTGALGVAVVTAGPGVTNAMTGIANAHVARAPVLVLSGVPPTAQENRGALQDLVHTDLVRSITRYARTVREPSLAIQELDEAIERACGTAGGEPGPAYLDFPTDVLRAEVPRSLELPERFRAPQVRAIPPDPAAIATAAEALATARRPLVVTGRGARAAAPALIALLDRLGAAYLDTGESRGLVPDDHPSVVAAMRATAMGEADLVMTVGRRLDFQLAYGSPAVFGRAAFVRIADVASELRDNRRGAVEIFASAAPALSALADALTGRTVTTDREWVTRLRAGHLERVDKLRRAMAQAPPGADGRMHPNRLLAAVQERLPPDVTLVVDGGDLLSFARVGLSATSYLDPGSLGCLGVGVPFGIAASLAGRAAVVVTGDGAFGFNAIEVDTAVRHRAPVVIVVANNGAWQIEVHDQSVTYGRVVGTRLQFADHAAMARAFGMHGERVERAEDLAGALGRAFERRPALVDVLVTPHAASSDAKSGLAWVPDLQAVAAWDDAERVHRGGT